MESDYLLYRFDYLLYHVGHEVEVASYGHPYPVNVAIECIDCGSILFDIDKED